MRATFYKLGEYKIIESGTGELGWEAHFGLGALQEGRCFRKGRILFIGPAESDRLGFLKGEFLDHLKPFPVWLKTKYFCRGFDVYHCKTGKKVTKVEMQLWMLNRGIDEGDRLYSDRRARVDVAFRLQKYEIIEKTNNQFVWRTYAGPNTVSSGNCIILEDILFIGSWQNEQSTINKRQFLSNLQQLPKWDRTKYFCPKLSLHECKTGNRIQEERKGWPGEKRATETNISGNEYKTSPESKFPNGAHRETFFARLSSFLGSLANLSGSRVEHDRFFHFRFIKSYISKSIAFFRAFGIWVLKGITYTVTLIFLIITSLFSFIVDYLKGHYKRRHDKKDENSFDHHEDH
ncbi:hypothetical protein ACFL7E_08115 [Thermodesulfobacteriota bacterium]